MIERWLQFTCDYCGETDNSTSPNMTVAEFIRTSKFWRRVGTEHACCKECADNIRSGKARP